MTIAIRRLHHPALFVLSAAAVYAVSLAIVRSLEDLGNAPVVAAAVTADLVLIVPLLYYWFLVRGRGWPLLSCVPVFLLSLVTATWIVPPEHHGALTVAKTLVIPLELAVLGFLMWQGARIVRGTREPSHGDFYERLRANAKEVTGNRWVADILAFEASILFFALFSWRSRPAESPLPTFSHHRRILYGTAVVGISIAILLELVPVHILLELWSPTAAWLATGLGLYSFLWLLGDYRAIVLRPSVINGDTLQLRVGLRWNAEVPIAAIRSIRKLEPWESKASDTSVQAVVMGTPRLVLELSQPVEVRGVYGWRRRTESIAITVDDEERFIAALHQRSAGPTL